jgi:hypothetical protein
MNAKVVPAHPIPQKIFAWKTSDGKMHTSEREALEHENNLQFAQWASKNICVGGEWTASMVVHAIHEGGWLILRRP